ncbi:helix-turn-helix domain-containing protein [Pseudomonas aeruginosa]|nr:helix-turn-helix domain-containing protein [Pseudomonas aeruginosa]MDI4056916.1 helix-turn-helix domain-containing protein [Pseudomonas aeruginosa]MDI4167033.1 helix-turn-helix domain-containing protein [Pseudomonas aeruginosa]
METQNGIIKMRIVKEQINTRTEEYVSESQAAAMLQLAVGTLRNLRTVKSNGQPIPHIKKCGKVFYKRDDVIAYRDKPRARLEHEYPRIPVLFNDNPPPDLDPLTKLTTAEAAMAFGISKASLQIWRSKHLFLEFLPYHGKRPEIYYLACELAAFIREGRAYWKARSFELGIQFQPHPRSGRAA